MRAVDTNVLARWVLGDDDEQAHMAKRVMSEPVWIPLTVLLELGWMLDKPLGLPRATVAAMLRQVVDLETSVVERRPHMIWAIERYQAGGDWADMVHLVAISGHADSFATFDRTLARKAGNDSPVDIETLGKR